MVGRMAVVRSPSDGDKDDKVTTPMHLRRRILHSPANMPHKSNSAMWLNVQLQSCKEDMIHTEKVLKP